MGGGGGTAGMGSVKPFAKLESMALMNPVDPKLLFVCLRKASSWESDMAWRAGCGSELSFRGD